MPALVALRNNNSVSAPKLRFFELEAAEVVDVILDDGHSDFNSYNDIGKSKVNTAKNYLKKIYPNLKIKCFNKKITKKNSKDILDKTSQKNKMLILRSLLEK